MIYCPWRRGATAWEWQCGRVYIRYLHLVGGNCPSRWDFWARTSFHWDDSDKGV